jgi:hypothetical protein
MCGMFCATILSTAITELPKLPYFSFFRTLFLSLFFIFLTQQLTVILLVSSLMYLCVYFKIVLYGYQFHVQFMFVIVASTLRAYVPHYMEYMSFQAAVIIRVNVVFFLFRDYYV